MDEPISINYELVPLNKSIPAIMVLQKNKVPSLQSTKKKKISVRQKNWLGFMNDQLIYYMYENRV